MSSIANSEGSELADFKPHDWVLNAVRLAYLQGVAYGKHGIDSISFDEVVSVGTGVANGGNIV